MPSCGWRPGSPLRASRLATTECPQPFDAPATVCRIAHVQKVGEGENTNSFSLACFDAIDSTDEFLRVDALGAAAALVHAFEIECAALHRTHRRTAAAALDVGGDPAWPGGILTQDLVVGHHLEDVGDRRKARRALPEHFLHRIVEIVDEERQCVDRYLHVGLDCTDGGADRGHGT